MALEADPSSVRGPASGPGGWLGALRRVGAGLVSLPRPLRVGIVLGWMAGIWLLSERHSVLPKDYRSPIWPFLANLGHTPLFGLLTLWIVAAAMGREAVPAGRGGSPPALQPGRARSALALVLTLLYGLIDEWHQSGVSGRDASVRDVGLDVVGSLAVLWIVATVGRPGAREGLLRARLAIAVALCLVAAWALTFVGS